MNEQLQKLEPYIEWVEKSPMQSRFRFSTKMEICLEQYGQEDETVSYCFAVKQNSACQQRVSVSHLYGTIAAIDAEFQNKYDNVFDFAEGSTLSTKEKEMLLHMMYYLLTDAAYYNLVALDASKKIGKELNFLLMDVLMDSNPYFESIASEYEERLASAK